MSVMKFFPRHRRRGSGRRKAEVRLENELKQQGENETNVAAKKRTGKSKFRRQIDFAVIV